MAEPLTANSMPELVRLVTARVRKAAAYVDLGVPDIIHEPSGEPMGEIMAVHEYGLNGMHERAPFGVTMAKNQNKYKRGLRKAAVKALDGSMQGYERLGADAVGDVQESISEGLQPENAPSTIAAKNGKDTPLIDTGFLRQSIGYEVQRT